jgi:hypothetical protein
MATIRIVLGIICLAFFWQLAQFNSNFLSSAGRKAEGLKVGWWGHGNVANHRQINSTIHQLTNLPTQQLFSSTTQQLPSLPTQQLHSSTTTQLHRSTILRIAQAQMGVREATGKNDGIVVEKYLKYTGNKKGEPWCASFVSWVYGKAGFIQPKTAWSPSLFPLARQTLNPKSADIFGIYFANLQRIGHCGLVEGTRGNWIYTIEGNTNLAGSREGAGVYRKLRHKRSIKYYANWLSNRKEGGS